MKNYQYFAHVYQSSTVVGFRVSDLELKKLRETKDTLVKLGIKGTTSDTLRVILNSFNLESWKQQTQQSFAKS
jgi:hypothetical protein